MCGKICLPVTLDFIGICRKSIEKLIVRVKPADFTVINHGFQCHTLRIPWKSADFINQNTSDIDLSSIKVFQTKDQQLEDYGRLQVSVSLFWTYLLPVELFSLDAFLTGTFGLILTLQLFDCFNN